MNRSQTLGKKVRGYRRRYGLTQKQFAALAGVSQSSISKIEEGSRLRQTTQAKISAALNKTPTVKDIAPNNVALKKVIPRELLLHLTRMKKPTLGGLLKLLHRL